jgi:hypothetical protein
LHNTIRRAAATIWRDGHLKVIRVESGFLASNESRAVPKELLV